MEQVRNKRWNKCKEVSIAFSLTDFFNWEKQEKMKQKSMSLRGSLHSSKQTISYPYKIMLLTYCVSVVWQLYFAFYLLGIVLRQPAAPAVSCLVLFFGVWTRLFVLPLKKTQQLTNQSTNQPTPHSQTQKKSIRSVLLQHLNNYIIFPDWENKPSVYYLKKIKMFPKLRTPLCTPCLSWVHLYGWSHWRRFLLTSLITG